MGVVGWYFEVLGELGAAAGLDFLVADGVALGAGAEGADSVG